MKNNFLESQFKGCNFMPFFLFKLKKNTPYIIVQYSLCVFKLFCIKISIYIPTVGLSVYTLVGGLRKVVSNV